MTGKNWLKLILIATVAAQMACSISTVTVPTQTSAEACPAETSDKKLLKNEEDGYCFLYPADYTQVPPRFIVLNPVNAPGDMLGDAWVDINMEAANGRTASRVADADIASAGQGFNITQSEKPVDGMQAIVVEGLPGQDSMRKVYIVSNDRLYTFTFTPWGQNQLENLYSTMINTLHFMPPTKAL